MVEIVENGGNCGNGGNGGNATTILKWWKWWKNSGKGWKNGGNARTTVRVDTPNLCFYRAYVGRNLSSPFHCFPKVLEWNGVSTPTPTWSLRAGPGIPISLFSLWFSMKWSTRVQVVIATGSSPFHSLANGFNEIERYRNSRVDLPFHSLANGFWWNWEALISLFY